ncbi:MAG: flagellar hook-associated protein FlgK [Burkholderiales bacterium]|nr:flagellar hook-associated protein FlgK [Burkholderiales bacterium]
MASALFGIATGALNAARSGLQTTSHNISNANTAGYSRQGIVQSTNASLFTGAGFMGQGVNVSTVQRQYSGFLESQVQTSQTRLSRFETWHGQMAQIDDLLADPTAGLTPAMNDFFAGVQTLSQHPADTAARQSLVSSASALAARFQSLDNRFSRMLQDSNGRIGASVDAINGYTSQIAELNDRIRLASSNDLQPPNDLLDERDRLIRGLNGEIEASAVPQSDGSVNIFFGNGQPGVVGSKAFTLAATRDPANPETTTVGLQTAGGVVQFRAADVGGGNLAGLMAFRDVSLNQATNALGRIALGLAQTFNDQHAAGMDLTGALGGAFFNAAQPQVLSYSSNTGGATMAASIASLSALTDSDYRVAFDGTNYRITRMSDNSVQTFATLPQTLDGVTFSIAGAPAAGDSFLVQPTRNGAREFGVLISDLNRIAAASPVRSASARANIGSGVIGAPTVSLPPDSNLTQTVTLTFNAGGTFDVTGTGTGNPTGVAFTAGGAISYNGWTVRIDGTPQPGDSFTISLNSGGSGDNGNALQLGKVQTLKSLMGGSATLGDGYATLVSGVGNKTRELAAGAASQLMLVDNAVAARESLSGVNLDEEAANLLRYQQAYQAAGRVIQIADEMFSTILSIGA